MTDPMQGYREGFVSNASNHPNLKLLGVELHHEIEGWYATSDSEPGWTAAADSYEELQVLMAEFAQMNGYHGWVGVMPTEPTLDVSATSEGTE